MAKKSSTKPDSKSGIPSATSSGAVTTMPMASGLSSLLTSASPPTSPTTAAFLPSPAIPDENASEKTTRIITHMNSAHTDSLGRYLAYFGRVWAISARSPHLVRLDRDTFTIASTGPIGTSSSRGLHTTISFEPPLAPDLGDVRQRLIDMDREAITGLRRRDVTVKRYAWPTARWMWAWWVFVAVAWSVFIRRQNFFEGAILHDWLLRQVLNTKWIVFLRTWQPRVRLMMLGLHALETGEMMVSKLPKNNVELFSDTWWAWTLSVMFEGWPVWERLDEVVREEEIKREKVAGAH